MVKNDAYVGIDSSDSLMHYGVKGMKWGRRKKNDSSVRSRTARAYRFSRVNSHHDNDSQNYWQPRYGYVNNSNNGRRY